MTEAGSSPSSPRAAAEQQFQTSSESYRNNAMPDRRHSASFNTMELEARCQEVDGRGAFYQCKPFLAQKAVVQRKKKALKPENWDNRWNVTYSKANNVRHPFYRQYFDKEPAETHFCFQYAFGHNSPDALPGIVDVNYR